uniref:Uncharacterized protein n=1 Tax=Helianthus annuus TaxID=4232 RepID=A0A251V0E2_HELAN
MMCGCSKIYFRVFTITLVIYTRFQVGLGPGPEARFSCYTRPVSSTRSVYELELHKVS